jgi:hypothetical protein
MVSIPFEAFELGGLRVLEHHLRPVDAILEQLPSVTLSASDEVEEKLAHGKLLDIEDFEGELPLGLVEKSVVRIMGPDGHFRALGRMKSGGGISPFKQWVYPS